MVGGAKEHRLALQRRADLAVLQHLLDDVARAVADRFATQYTALRRREGWVGPDGVEDPERGDRRLWAGRLESARREEM